MNHRTTLLALLLLSLPTLSRADDWPQFRGPNRDGVSKETGLLKEWPQGGPKLLWTYSGAGVGYSGPAVVGDRLYLSGGRGESEFVYALDLKSIDNGTVKELWSAKLGPLFQWNGNTWNAGPNVTPTVDGETVYALSGFGDLVAVDASCGKTPWRKNLPKDLGGEVNPIGGGLEEPTPLGWGYAGAPLVNGEQLIVTPGGKKGLLAALNKKTGDLIWQSKEITEQASYSSPILIDVGGIKQYVQVVNAGAFGVAVKDGKRLWNYQRQPAYDDVVVATPVFSEKLLFSTVGFAQGSDLVQLSANRDGMSAEKVYSNKAIENRDGGVVLVDGHLYGHSENKGWFCQEFKTGKILWSERENLGRGSITYADGNLYCCPEKGGMVVMLEATPKGWNERGRLKLPAESKQRKPSGGMWTYPVIADGKLYLRDQELVYCYDIKQ
jgi:outer membrane protein assembly factor BamB